MKKKYNAKWFGLILMLVVFGSLALVACGDNTATNAPAKATPEGTHTPAELAGESKPLGAGAVRSWVQRDSYGNPSAIGVTFGEAALTNLPVKPEGNEIVLGLPKENLAIPFNHISIDWNPQGHEPPGIYDRPHFDFHFYLISQEERKSVLPTDGVSALQPEKEAIPVDYIAPQPIAVPAMGVHWLDKAAPELNKQPFTTTFIYGFVKGNMAFAEPMITKAFLEGKPNFTTDLKLPAKYPKSGLYYPTKYSVKYDSVNKEYTVALEGLTLR